MKNWIALASLLLIVFSSLLFALEKTTGNDDLRPLSITNKYVHSGLNNIKNAHLEVQATNNNLTLESGQLDWHDQVLTFLTNPTIAYLLMLVAMYGLFFELANPGMVVPGVVGVIALVLVLYAFELMPLNYTGLALVLIGIALMIVEGYVSSFGVLGIGGVVAFTLGSILLFNKTAADNPLNLAVVIAMSLITFAFFFMIATLALRSQKKAIVTGQEGLIGHEGVVLSVINKQITVRVNGEIWSAVSKHSLNAGQKIKVTHLKGLMLTVEPLDLSKRLISGE